MEHSIGVRGSRLCAGLAVLSLAGCGVKTAEPDKAELRTGPPP